MTQNMQVTIADENREDMKELMIVFLGGDCGGAGW